MSGTEPAPPDLAAALVAAHRDESRRPDAPAPPLAELAEGVRSNGWSLRSALVRLAQLEPVRVAAVLEVVRRIEGALKPGIRLLQKTAVPTAPALVHLRADSPVSVDGRITDLARARVRYGNVDDVVSGYADDVGVSQDELELLPALEAAVWMEELAIELAEWAPVPTRPAPLARLDEIVRRVASELDEAGVPREADRPWPGRR